MFYFDLKNTAIFEAIKREGEVKIVAILSKIFFSLSFLLFLIGLLGILTEKTRFFGLSLILLVWAAAFWLEELFFNSKLKKPKPKAALKEAILEPERFNLAEFLDLEAAKIFFRAIKFAQARKISETNSSILFYFLLEEKNNFKLNFIFSRLLLNQKEIKKVVDVHLRILKREEFREVFSEDFQKTVLESLKIAKEQGKNLVGLGDLLCALAKHDLVFQKILIDFKLRFDDIKNLAWWIDSWEEKAKERKKFWERKNLARHGSLAKDWAAGYTITLDKFSIDWTEIVRKQGFPETVGHKEAIEASERILARRESRNSALIVGEPGSGRRSMVRALAKKSALGESLPEVNYKRVVQLNLPSLSAQAASLDEAEILLDTIFQEIVSAGNIILVIDDFHNYVGRTGIPRAGAIDISGAIASYLSLIHFQVIAITNFEGLHTTIEQNTSILSLFEKVEVSEISERETIILLENLAQNLEREYKILISYPALRHIISYCSKYLPAIPFPEKALNLLDELMVYVAQKREKILLPQHVSKIVTEKTQIPVGEIESKEKEILLNLEKLIHQRIINQEEAVKEVSTALRRARAEISVRKGTMGSFLFLGPTGVGKTETAKAIADIYFGSEDRMIRLDMSEFQNLEDISRLIGSAGQEGLLTTPVRENPFSLLLLDEFEKAHPNILNLFLQVFDEGHLTDGLGRKVDFKNTIIIATSNAGYQIILEALKSKTDWPKVKEKLLDYIFAQGIFRPELINRFDAVVVFKPLSRQNLFDIAELLLSKLKKNLGEKEILFVITPQLKEKIVEMSYSPLFGARQMQRVIQDKVGNPLAEALLRGEIKRGDKIEIDADFQIIKK